MIDVIQTLGRIDSLARHHSSTHVDPATRLVSSKPLHRQRVSRACKRRSTSKIRCDGQLPCEKCTISSNHCYYEEPKKRKSRAQLSSSQPAKRLNPQDTNMHAEVGTSDVNEGQQTPATQVQAVVRASSFSTNAQRQSPAIPAPDQFILADIGYLLGSKDAMSNGNTLHEFNGRNILSFQNDWNDLGWMTGSLGPYLWLISFGLGQDFDIFHTTDGLDATTRQTLANAASGSQITLQLQTLRTSTTAHIPLRLTVMQSKFGNTMLLKLGSTHRCTGQYRSCIHHGC